MTSKKSEPGTALAPSGESGFAILDDAGAGTLMIDTIKELGLSSFEMNRIKIPAGGSSAWEIQTLDGERAATEIVCTILHCKGNEKSWWMTTGEDSGGGPPDCVSHDGISGVGINRVLTEDDSEADIETHDCASCAWNQFGSSRKPGSKGKDCSDTAYLYFFEEDARLPTLLVVPPHFPEGRPNLRLEAAQCGQGHHLGQDQADAGEEGRCKREGVLGASVVVCWRPPRRRRGFDEEPLDGLQGTPQLLASDLLECSPPTLLPLRFSPACLGTH